MQKNQLSFEQLPAAVYELRSEVSDLKRLLTEQLFTSTLITDDKPLSIEEAATFLGISKQTIYQNINKIPHRKRFGRLYFFRPNLSTYLNEGDGVTNE